MDMYRARMNQYGTTSRERLHNRQKQEFLQYLNTTPNRREFTIDGVEYSASFLRKRDSEGKTQIHIMAPLTAPIDVGTLLYWNDEYWLVLYKTEPSKTSYFDGVVKKCNHRLKWIDSKGIDRQISCHLSGFKGKDMVHETSANGFGQNSSYLYASINAELTFVTQRNTETENLKMGHRFVINNEAWQLINIDKESNQKLIYMRLKKVMKDTVNDDFEDGYADVNTRYSWSVKVLNGENFDLQIGDSVQMQAIVYELGNKPADEEVVIKWYSEDPDIVSVTEDGLATSISEGETIVRAYIENYPEVNDDSKIHSTYFLDDKTSYSFDGDKVVKQGQTVQYSVTKTLNGVHDEETKIGFRVEKGSNLVCEFNRIDNYTVEIEFRKDAYGTLLLQANDGEWTEEREIEIVSLFA